MPQRFFLFVLLVVAAGAAPAASLADAGKNDIAIERGFLPDAAPSAFAIGFPHGVSVCFDAVRGGVNYAWTGGFIDMQPARPGTAKLTKPAVVLGDVQYRESGGAPLRLGDSGREPSVRFAGYRLLGDAIEFRYTIDDVLVREEIRARPDGTGVTRRFRPEIPDSGKTTVWWFVPGANHEAKIVAPRGQPHAEGIRFDAVGPEGFAIDVIFAKPTP